MGSGKASSSFHTLSEDDLRALRGSKFAPLPAPPPPARAKQPRLAHPGGPIKTNKAAALAKFLERKLQQPGGLDSLDPNLVEVAVKSAQETMFAGKAGGPSSSSRIIHVASFDDSKEHEQEKPKEKKQKRKDSVQDEDKRKGKKWKKNKKKKKKGYPGVKLTRLTGV